MKTKLFFIISSIILLLSGCSLVYINSKSIDETVTSILSTNINMKTVSREGYSYFLPQGVNLKTVGNLNSVLYYNHKKMYLYVDLISYYYKKENTYKVNDQVYYSKRIDINNKDGYLEINQINDDEYFIEYMYNYSKIEAHASSKDLKKTLTTISYILGSIKFEDSLLDSLVGEGSLKYKEEQFDIFNPNGSNTSFLDVIKDYDDGRLDAKDEDVLELNENIK